MIKWILKILGLCDHRYETIKVVTHSIDGCFWYYSYHVRCSHCGKIKRFKVK